MIDSEDSTSDFAVSTIKRNIVTPSDEKYEGKDLLHSLCCIISNLP